jgi:hypothetical protein
MTLVEWERLPPGWRDLLVRGGATRSTGRSTSPLCDLGPVTLVGLCDLDISDRWRRRYRLDLGGVSP